MNYAVIDCGSNSIRVCVYQFSQNKPQKLKLLWSKKRMAGLASYLNENDYMSDDGIEQAINIIDEFLDRIHSDASIEQTFLFATEVLRRATNAQEIEERIYKRCHIRPEIISGNYEALYGFIGSMGDNKHQNGIQIDVGGSSTEIVSYSDYEINDVLSLPIGSLRMYVEHVDNLVPTPREADEIRIALLQELTQYPTFSCKQTDDLTIVGGSGRASGKLRDFWFNNGKKIRPNTISSQQITAIIEDIMYDPKEATRRILQVTPERVHTVVPGMVIISTLMEYFSCQQLKISKYGVREGYLLAHVSPYYHDLVQSFSH